MSPINALRFTTGIGILFSLISCGQPKVEGPVIDVEAVPDFRQPGLPKPTETLPPVVGEPSNPSASPNEYPTSPDYDPYANLPPQLPQRRSIPTRDPEVAQTEPRKDRGLFEGILEDEIRRRAPEILGSILGDSPDSEVVKGVLEEAPVVWEEIVNRSKAEGKSPAEVVGTEVVGAILEEKAGDLRLPPELGQNLPEVIENVKKGAEDGSLMEAIGAIVLREILKGDN